MKDSRDPRPRPPTRAETSKRRLEEQRAAGATNNQRPKTTTRPFHFQPLSILHSKGRSKGLPFSSTRPAIQTLSCPFVDLNSAIDYLGGEIELNFSAKDS
ncbi:hypothetical protein THAOC_33623 [Thalassiosira oceanica]|uniref:Uncharacterized protein n=1 Tax=Thalassiosira oceanica TaxID=159749 RepID=K0R6S8_THAOC|nr:hypothetical protein THAOC_33623 [Thalassiosira oceanica]|eukprot:EJK47644.1 hypothetical protein THAOC_33623 [Thalassiosira oceanica]